MSEQTPPEGEQKTDATGHAPGMKSKAAAAKAAVALALSQKMGALKGKLSGLSSIKEVPKILLSFPAILIRGDLSSKLLFLGFLGGLSLVIYTSAKLYDHFLAHRFVRKEQKLDSANSLHEFVKARQELRDAESNLVFLERFQIQMGVKSGVLKLAEIELYVEADKPATAAWITEHMIPIKEIVSQSMQNKNYDDFITDEAKEVLKAALLKDTNSFLHKKHVDGKIKRVYISQFVMSD